MADRDREREKNDVFIGNVTFNTTEEQLRSIFSVVGPIKNVRILTDKESGRPKGFAFVEYMDVNTALAAIRNLDGTELNGRKLRVSYSNKGNMRETAKAIGQDVTETSATARHEFQVIASLQLHEAWDILDAMKKLTEEDRGEKARALFEACPQLVGALAQIQRRLGIVSNEGGTGAPSSAAGPSQGSSSQQFTDAHPSHNSVGGFNANRSAEYFQPHGGPHGGPHDGPHGGPLGGPHAGPHVGPHAGPHGGPHGPQRGPPHHGHEPPPGYYHDDDMDAHRMYNLPPPQFGQPYMRDRDRDMRGPPPGGPGGDFDGDFIRGGPPPFSHQPRHSRHAPY